MPADAKLGLVIGVLLVIVIALVFFKKEGDSQLRQQITPPAATQPATPVRKATFER
jgi:hypothetical protein